MTQAQLILKVINRLQEASETLDREKKPPSPFYSILRERLSELPNWVKQRGSSENCPRIGGLAQALEDFCNVAIILAETFLPRSPYYTSSGGSAPQFSALEGYPALIWLLRKKDNARLAVRTIALNRRPGSPALRMRLLESLRSYHHVDLEAMGVSPSYDDLPVVEKPELKRDIGLLYNTLGEYCCTRLEGVAGQMELRIRLHRSEENETFGVLFMGHPHNYDPNDGSTLYWQDTRISVLRSVTISGRYDPQRTPLGEAEFCDLISRQEQDGMSLVIKNKTIFFERPTDRARTWLSDYPSISLDELLRPQSTQMSEKMKSILACFLAKAVWQYYRSPLMLEPWTKDNIHFLFEQRPEQGYHIAGLFVNEPLLSVSLQHNLAKQKLEGGKGASSTPKKERSIHMLPKILSLGIMLLEIEKGVRIENLWGEWPLYCPNGRPNVNTSYNICRGLIKQPNFFSETADPLEDIITKCLDPASYFGRYANDEIAVCDALFKLVSKLEAWVSVQKPHNVKPLYVPMGPDRARDIKARRNPPIPRKVLEAWQNCAETSPGKLVQTGGTMSQRDTTSSDMWFQRLDSFNHVVEGTKCNDYDEVKIGIIDTGVHKDSNAAANITKFKDFVNEANAQPCDNTGHGTTLVDLVFKVCSAAKVYAARTFESDQESLNTLELTVKAIDWCIAEGVDVICMSFGFHRNARELHEAVKRAISARVLIFAAPSNDSNAGELAYPARYSDQVICIFSTDGGVKNSRSINPSGRPMDINLAILGEGITTFTKERKEGTSFSTAIATGLAGRLLDFSRHIEVRDKIRFAHYLKEKIGMMHVFLEMSDADEGYSCVSPWKLLPQDLRGRVPFKEPLDDEEISLSREHICETISRCLEKL